MIGAAEVVTVSAPVAVGLLDAAGALGAVLGVLGITAGELARLAWVEVGTGGGCSVLEVEHGGRRVMLSDGEGFGTPLSDSVALGVYDENDALLAFGEWDGAALGSQYRALGFVRLGLGMAGELNAARALELARAYRLLSARFHEAAQRDYMAAGGGVEARLWAESLEKQAARAGGAL